MKDQNIHLLIAELRNWEADKNLPPKEFGICDSITTFIRNNGVLIDEFYGSVDLVQQVASTSKEFEYEYSGDFSYPIAHKSKAPSSAFDTTVNLWDNSPYGLSRKKLCGLIADYLEVNQ